MSNPEGDSADEEDGIVVQVVVDIQWGGSGGLSVRGIFTLSVVSELESLSNKDLFLILVSV